MLFLHHDVVRCDRRDTKASALRSSHQSKYRCRSGIGWARVGETGVVVCGGDVFDDGLCHGALHDG